MSGRAASDNVWHLQCTCQSCARDIMAAGGLCPMCRAKTQSTTKTRFEVTGISCSLSLQLAADLLVRG